MKAAATVQKSKKSRVFWGFDAVYPFFFFSSLAPEMAAQDVNISFKRKKTTTNHCHFTFISAHGMLMLTHIPRLDLCSEICDARRRLTYLVQLVGAASADVARLCATDVSYISFLFGFFFFKKHETRGVAEVVAAEETPLVFFIFTAGASHYLRVLLKTSLCLLPN